VDFSPYEALETASARVGVLFQGAAGELLPFGMRCLVRISDSAVDMRVERQGKSVCGLRLRFDNSFRDGRLVMAFAWPRITGDGINGWATTVWDTDAGQPKLCFLDMGAMGDESLVTADELFHLLWTKILNYVENAR
jgi:hypothetical protein